MSGIPHQGKLGRLAMAIALAVAVESAAIGQQMLFGLKNAYRAAPSQSKNKGSRAREMRAAKRRKNIRKHRKGAAQGNTASRHGGRKYG